MVKKLYNIREASHVLGLSESQIYKLIMDKKLRAVKRRGRWEIPRREINRYIAESWKRRAF